MGTVLLCLSPCFSTGMNKGTDTKGPSPQAYRPRKPTKKNNTRAVLSSYLSPCIRITGILSGNDKAMTYFAVDTLKINNQMESLSGIYRELLNEAREIQQLALNLDSDMEGIRHVKVFLSALSDETKRNASSMKNLQNALSSVLSLFMKKREKETRRRLLLFLSSNNNAHSSDESNADTSSIDKYMSLLGQLFLILPGYLSPIVWINLISCASAETLHFFL